MLNLENFRKTKSGGQFQSIFVQKIYRKFDKILFDLQEKFMKFCCKNEKIFEIRIL